MNNTTMRRLAIASAGAVALLLAAPTAASAHVTVRPDVDTQGSHAKLTFRVPNESGSASTVQLTVDIPAERPFRSVRVQPHPGWTAQIVREELPEPLEVGDYVLDEVVTSITWTAEEGSEIGPDEFDEFAISVPLGEAGDYPLPATQIYDDGETVAWAGEPGSDRPAPLLTVRAAAEPDDESATDADAGSDGLARGLALGGLAAGAAGLGVGGTLWRRSRAS